MTVSTPARKASQKVLTAWLAEHGFRVNAARRQRDGSVRIYLWQVYPHQGKEVHEVIWSPRHPFVVSLYDHAWIETGRGNSGGHQEDVLVGRLDLPQSVYNHLSASI